MGGCRPIAARPGRGATAMSAASASPGARTATIRALYIPLRHPDTDNFDPAQVYRWLKDLIASGVRIVTMNGVYDFGWLRAEAASRCRPADRLEEVGALATMVDENLFRYSLDALCERTVCPARMRRCCAKRSRPRASRHGARRSTSKNHIWQLPARYVGPYAEADAVNTLLLFEKLNPVLDQEKTRDAYRLEVDLLPMVLEMRRRGIRIDQDAAEQARDLLLGNAMPRWPSFRRSSAPPSAWPRSTAADGRRRPSMHIRSIIRARRKATHHSRPANPAGWQNTSTGCRS